MQDPNYPKREKVVFIDIDNLGVDKCNIREGSWDCDKELINSIRNKGVIQPLIVRKTSLELNKKYGIVCGSRRYNASVEAGLGKVPCLIRNLTNLEAMEESMMENRQRKGTPAWMNVEYIGRMHQEYSISESLSYFEPVKKSLSNFDPVKKSLSYFDSVKKISETGISRATVERYIKIFNLREEIKGLLREPSERTRRQREYLKLFQWRETRRTLLIGHAELLTKLKGFVLEKQMEVAVFILNKSFEMAKKIVSRVEVHKDKDLSDIYGEIRGKLGIVERVFQFDRELVEALEDACMDRQVRSNELVSKILKYWLKEYEYLGGQDLFNRDK